MATMKIFNLIILDASGSMESIYAQALSGVNETLATIRMAQEEHPELRQYVTLASFSAGERFLNHIYSAIPIAEACNITREDYPLLGCTALYDAMGTCISKLQQKVTHSDQVLVTINTNICKIITPNFSISIGNYVLTQTKPDSILPLQR